jgi:hypothetical protein
MVVVVLLLLSSFAFAGHEFERDEYGQFIDPNGAYYRILHCDEMYFSNGQRSGDDCSIFLVQHAVVTIDYATGEPYPNGPRCPSQIIMARGVVNKTVNDGSGLGCGGWGGTCSEYIEYDYPFPNSESPDNIRAQRRLITREPGEGAAWMVEWARAYPSYGEWPAFNYCWGDDVYFPPPDEEGECMENYASGKSDEPWCEETLQGVLGLLREWLQILLRRSASPDPGGPGPPGGGGGPGPPGGGGGAGPPGGGGGADPDDPSLVSPGDFAPHDEVGFWGEIPLIYVDLQARLDAVRSDIDEVSAGRFPFVVMRYVPELAEDGSPASPCNDIVITLVGTPTALGWCGSGVQAFLTGWGRSIMGVLVTVVYGFGMAHTVVRS